MPVCPYTGSSPWKGPQLSLATEAWKASKVPPPANVTPSFQPSLAGDWEQPGLEHLGFGVFFFAQVQEMRAVWQKQTSEKENRRPSTKTKQRGRGNVL